ncbi:Histone H4 [Verticillium dahliae VDG2]|nr:Histone H4 [Verticillium dahliae VDG2]
MGYSVRKYEPRLALVPGDDVPAYAGCAHEDVFYARLLDVAVTLGVRVVVFELGDEGQAARVLRLVRRREALRGAACEVWRDWPDVEPQEDEARVMSVGEDGDDEIQVVIRGSGNVRSVLVQIPEHS